MNLHAQPKSFWWAIASCVVTMVGSFGPWARVVGTLAHWIGEDSITGTAAGPGRTVFIAAGVAMALIVLRQFSKHGLWLLVLAFVAASVGAAVAVYNWTDINGFANESGIVETAWGIYLAAIGSVSLALASFGIALETHTPKPRVTGVPRPTH